jgi:hypothetical protein
MVAAKTADAIGLRKATTVGFREAAELASVEMLAQAHQPSVNGAASVIHAHHMAAQTTAMTARSVHSTTVTTAHLSALHTAAMTASVSTIATIDQRVASGQKTATLTVQTAQPAMIRANQPSAVLASRTQTRRLSSKTRFLSV